MGLIHVLDNCNEMIFMQNIDMPYEHVVMGIATAQWFEAQWNNYTHVNISWYRALH